MFFAPELTFENFVSFVASEDPEKKINHLGNGWNDCAVGEFVKSILPETSSRELHIYCFDFTERLIPRDVQRVLVNGRLSSIKVPTYGKLDNFLQKFV